MTLLITLGAIDNVTGSCTADGDTAASFAALSAGSFPGTFECSGIHYILSLA